MATRADITTKYAKAYKKATKKTKGTLLDQIVAVTGWTRDNARRRLTQAANHPPGPGETIATRVREPRARKYSYDAVKTLRRVWATSGVECGKYLHATKPGTLLNSATTIRRPGDEVEDEPGFSDGDTVVRCGPVESGEFARTLNLTDFQPDGPITAPCATTPTQTSLLG